MWTLGFILIGQLLLKASCDANALPEQAYTENGRPFAYPLEEDIAEEVGEETQYPLPENLQNSGSEYGGDVDESGAGMSQRNRDFPDDLANKAGGMEMEIGKNEKSAPIYKREGQAEFDTFVDPTQNRQLIQDKQLFNGGGGFEKRARADKSGQSLDGEVGDTVFIAVTTVCTAAAVFGLVGAAFVWHRVHKRHKAAQDSEYPHYGVTGPAKERSGSTSPVAVMDAKLASSAQLYHYQHTKQQIIAMEQSASDGKGQDSDDSEGEEDEGDFSVYEYPGLAPTGDIEVTNPLFENAASPQTKTDPKAAQLQPRIHQRFQGRGEDQ